MNKLQSLLFCALILGSAISSEAAEGANQPWGYAGGKPSEGPDNWKDHYPECGGQNQSPIDIRFDEAKYTGVLQMNPFKFHGYDDDTISKSAVHLVNTGSTAKVSIDDTKIGIQGGGLPHHYLLKQFHWHWGAEDTKGSEHTFNGQMYPAEVHFVHVNSWYANAPLSEILSYPDGLAVVGVFIEVGDRNPVFDPIIDYFEHASKDDANATSVRLNLSSLMGFFPKDTSQYYRYQGSLTTPPCSEAVIWTVMKNTIQISAAQLEKFRTVLKKDKSVDSNKTPTSSVNNIVDNFRPTQPLNGRVVYSSFTQKSIITLPDDMQTHKWSYDGAHGSPSPTKWGDRFEKCYGRQQSPIHIEHSDAIPSPFMATQPWVLTNYDKTPANFETFLQNNGHTVVAQVTDGVTISGGGLPATYRLAQFHLHWGSEKGKGSEHMLNGKQYPAEVWYFFFYIVAIGMLVFFVGHSVVFIVGRDLMLHLVHVNRLYKTMNQIENNQDGLAVLGVLIEVGAHNKAYDPIIEQLNNIKYITETQDVELDLKSLTQFLPDDTSEFYRYHGSLTTPPCHEAVMWTVFKKPVTMSEAQMNAFRTQVFNMRSPNATNIVSDTSDGDNGGHDQATSAPDHGGHGNGADKAAAVVVDNYRPVQKLYDRVVKYGKILPSDNNVSGASSLTASLTALLSIALMRFFC